MSALQQETHVAHFYRRAESTTTARGEPIEGEWGEYASADVRLTSAGGGFAQVVGGSRDDENPILSIHRPDLVDEIAEDDRAALDGDGFVFNPATPEDGDWFRVQAITYLFSIGRTARGLEATLTKVS